MKDEVVVRRSRILGLFAEIIHGPVGTLRAVEIAGRGVVAEVRCTLAVLADKVTISSENADEAIGAALASADRLMDLGAIEDDLNELWCCRRERDLDDAAFEVSLEQVVARLEAWHQSWTRESAEVRAVGE
ncbi:hypothetical protein [Micromonospora sp. WMMD812]|uniref:hypothetical protein n=1 Tax=Micromonospora sp. WMMD812 TaxID=3015152 RepID=UPI00248BDB84|nr:hypothetical protein [Micromonospora sp. WMMD812]WBB69089.1 hypothetical protein O7603_06990 [Micromonospora sp. WMMD812]